MRTTVTACVRIVAARRDSAAPRGDILAARWDNADPAEFRAEYDERRTAELRGYGITVVRFANDDLRADPDIVAA